MFYISSVSDENGHQVFKKLGSFVLAHRSALAIFSALTSRHHTLETVDLFPFLQT